LRLLSSNIKKISKKSPKITTFSITGDYKSDQNSKEYQFEGRVFYRKPFLNLQLDVLQSSSWKDKGSGSKKIFLAKSSELYDFQSALKFSPFKNDYYVAIYNRLNYDDLSDYYYDTRNAVGFGKSFYNGKLEADVSLGYHGVKNYDDSIFFLPSLRLNWDIGENWQIINRSYLFTNSNSIDVQNKITIRYNISGSWGLELNHNFEKSSYHNEKTRKKINTVSRDLQVGTSFRF
jgi:hypothetical protein